MLLVLLRLPRVLLLCFGPFLSFLVVYTPFISVVFFRFITLLPRGAHDLFFISPEYYVPGIVLFFSKFVSLSLLALPRRRFSGVVCSWVRRHSILLALLGENTFFVSYP